VKFDLGKFFHGFNILDGEIRGKLLFWGILIAIGGLILWAALIRPTRNDLQTVANRMDFHGSRIDRLYISSDKNESRETDRRLELGAILLYDQDGDWSAGPTISFKF